MKRAASRLACGLGVVLVGTAVTVIAQSRDAPIPHAVGQSVTASFEGWYPNADGTFSLSFGYLNRNFDEPQDIPVGPSNMLSPGPADQGQPTHFMSRRQTGVFTVVVPADFGEQELAWTLVSGGETIVIPGHLRPEWKIDALHEVTSGNTPPRIRLAVDGAIGQGPSGPRARVRTAGSRPVELHAWVTDDGVKKRPSSRPPQLGIVWSKYRGPGHVSLDDSRPSLDENGHAVTTATFDVAGDYVLRVLAWDDSGPQGAIMAGGFQCCWTNAFVEVTVSK